MSVFDILKAARSSDDPTRNHAESTLRSAAEADLGGYLAALAGELKDESKPFDTRQLAGVLIKNELDANNPVVLEAKQSAWIALPVEQKNAIKVELVGALSASEPKASYASAQAISKIATIELPRGDWPDLLEGLVAYANGLNGASGSLRVASIHALGLICEEIQETDVLSEEAIVAIMAAIVGGMADGEALPVRKAATAALYNALDFAETCFKDANIAQRDAIMGAIYARCNDAADKRLQSSAFECLVRVADIYYSSMESYMDQLAALTASAAESADEAVATPAVEFWTCLAEEEVEAAPETNRGYIVKYAKPLVTLLTGIMVNHAKEDPSAEYTVEQAAANCMTSVACVVGDDIVPLAMEFIQPAYECTTDWRMRDAATLTFGCILAGPSDDAISKPLNGALPVMLGRLAGAAPDESAAVRHSTAWAIAHALETRWTAIDMSTHFPQILATARAGLADEARVAAKCANMIGAVAVNCKGMDIGDGRTPLTEHLPTLIPELVARADRDDWQDARLRVQCYEAISQLVDGAGACAEDAAFMLDLLKEVGRRMTEAIALVPTNADDRLSQESLVTVLTCVLQPLVSHLEKGVAEFAESIMDLVGAVLDSRLETAMEEALRVIGCLANAMDADFASMLPAALPRLDAALLQISAEGVMRWALWSVGEVINACGSALSPEVIDALVGRVLAAVSSKELARDVKPAALEVFGDVAFVMGTGSVVYVDGMLGLMFSAIDAAPFTSDDEDDMHYCRQLRKSVCAAFRGIFLAFIPDDDATPAEKTRIKTEASRIVDNVPKALEYVRVWVEAATQEVRDALDAGDENLEHTDAADDLMALLGLVGDFAALMGPVETPKHMRAKDSWVKRALTTCVDIEKRRPRHDASGAAVTSLSAYVKRMLK